MCLISQSVCNGIACFFAFSLIIEGTTEKVLQFKMPLKSIYNRNFGFNEQQCIFEHYGEFQARKSILIDIIFAIKKFQLTFSQLSPICLCLYYTKMRCSIKAAANLREALLRCSTLGQTPGLTHKQQTRLERISRNKHSSLLRVSVGYRYQILNLKF